MKLLFLVIGKTSEKYVSEGIEIYIKRLERFCDLEIGVVPDVKSTSALGKKMLMEKESVALLKFIEPRDFLVLLDEHGKHYSSVGFAEQLEKWMERRLPRIVFAVGGVYGFSPSLHERADAVISLSKMTFPHQLVRLIFAEQLYRAFSIIKGHPYHHP